MYKIFVVLMLNLCVVSIEAGFLDKFKNTKQSKAADEEYNKEFENGYLKYLGQLEETSRQLLKNTANLKFSGNLSKLEYGKKINKLNIKILNKHLAWLKELATLFDEKTNFYYLGLAADIIGEAEKDYKGTLEKIHKAQRKDRAKDLDLNIFFTLLRFAMENKLMEIYRENNARAEDRLKEFCTKLHSLIHKWFDIPQPPEEDRDQKINASARLDDRLTPKPEPKIEKKFESDTAAENALRMELKKQPNEAYSSLYGLDSNKILT